MFISLNPEQILIERSSAIKTLSISNCTKKSITIELPKRLPAISIKNSDTFQLILQVQYTLIKSNFISVISDRPLSFYSHKAELSVDEVAENTYIITAAYPKHREDENVTVCFGGVSKRCHYVFDVDTPLVGDLPISNYSNVYIYINRAIGYLNVTLPVYIESISVIAANETFVTLQMTAGTLANVNNLCLENVTIDIDGLETEMTIYGIIELSMKNVKFIGEKIPKFASIDKAIFDEGNYGICHVNYELIISKRIAQVDSILNSEMYNKMDILKGSLRIEADEIVFGSIVPDKTINISALHDAVLIKNTPRNNISIRYMESNVFFETGEIYLIADFIKPKFVQTTFSSRAATVSNTDKVLNISLPSLTDIQIELREEMREKRSIIGPNSRIILQNERIQSSLEVENLVLKDSVYLSSSAILSAKTLEIVGNPFVFHIKAGFDQISQVRFENWINSDKTTLLIDVNFEEKENTSEVENKTLFKHGFPIMTSKRMFSRHSFNAWYWTSEESIFSVNYFSDQSGTSLRMVRVTDYNSGHDPKKHQNNLSRIIVLIVTITVIILGAIVSPNFCKHKKALTDSKTDKISYIMLFHKNNFYNFVMIIWQFCDDNNRL